MSQNWRFASSVCFIFVCTKFHPQISLSLSTPVHSLSKLVFEMDDVKTEVKLQDFSQPWKFSDVVIVVEDERLHVHRAVLAMASPVFEKLFTTVFEEYH